MTREELEKAMGDSEPIAIVNFEVIGDYIKFSVNGKEKVFSLDELEEYSSVVEPCENCISREEVCKYIAEFVNHEYATDRECEMVELIISGIQHLPSIQPKTDILDKIRAEIEHKAHSGQWSDATMYVLLKAVAIIDKYKTESEISDVLEFRKMSLLQ